MADLRWTCINTKPNQVSRASTNLKRQGYGTYVPRYWSGSSARPLFPNYLFASIDLTTQSWHPIESTFGVQRVVRFSEGPAWVSQQIIQQLRARENHNGLIQLPKLRLAKGAALLVTKGQFDGHVVLFEAFDDRDRVFALLAILCQSVRIRLPKSSYEILNTA